jgi:hypothetical protein
MTKLQVHSNFDLDLSGPFSKSLMHTQTSKHRQGVKSHWHFNLETDSIEYVKAKFGIAMKTWKWGNTNLNKDIACCNKY